jgi:hypothetical protein
MLLPLVATGILHFQDDKSQGFGNFLQRYVNHEFSQQFINISLGVVLTALVLSIVLSLVIPPKESK